VLPIYEALEITSFIPENSGHTKPWVVSAYTPEGLKSFVVKLYTTEQVDHSNCVNNEVVCNILASEFELEVPKCALINIPDSITMRLSPEQQQQLDNTDPRPKFATEYLPNVNTAIIGLPKGQYQKRISMDMLYAFDNLIRNGDRGHPKTNLLLASDVAYLIDHELALRNQDIVNVDLKTLQIEDRFTKDHLFYTYLKKAKFKTKQSYFNEFAEYINHLNMNILNPYFHTLAQEGFKSNSIEILHWLNQVKQNIPIFVFLLKGSLQ
jgi:hypothetical protein